MYGNGKKQVHGEKKFANQYQPISGQIPKGQQNINVINNSYPNNDYNKLRMIEEFRKLNQNDQNEILNVFKNESNFQMQSMQNNNYYDPYLNEKIVRPNEIMQIEYQEKFQEQKLLDAQIMQQRLDYKDCWDFYYSAIATIENLALGISKKKQYGKYDEFDACSFKDKNQLVIQLLKILKNFRGAFEDYLKDYDGKIDYPEDPEITLNQIKNWKEMINDENINKYLDELVRILNQNSKMDFQKELNKYYSYYSKEKIGKETMQKGFEAVIYSGSHVRREEREAKNQFEEKGDLPDYKVERGVPAGRFNRKNNSTEIKKK